MALKRFVSIFLGRRVWNYSTEKQRLTKLGETQKKGTPKMPVFLEMLLIIKAEKICPDISLDIDDNKRLTAIPQYVFENKSFSRILAC